MAQAFLDANVFLYAAGRDHPLRSPARTVLERIRTGVLKATTSTEVVQELVYVVGRAGRRGEAVRLGRSVLALFPDLLPVTAEVMPLALDLVERDPRTSPRDAVHVATMLDHGIRTIVSADQDFDRIEGIERIDLATLERQ